MRDQDRKSRLRAATPEARHREARRSSWPRPPAPWQRLSRNLHCKWKPSRPRRCPPEPGNCCNLRHTATPRPAPPQISLVQIRHTVLRSRHSIFQRPRLRIVEIGPPKRSAAVPRSGIWRQPTTWRSPRQVGSAQTSSQIRLRSHPENRPPRHPTRQTVWTPSRGLRTSSCFRYWTLPTRRRHRHRSSRCRTPMAPTGPGTASLRCRKREWDLPGPRRPERPTW